MTKQGRALRIHPVASLFPEMNEAEYTSLKEDIQKHGLREPIWLSKDGRIIDGRHRYQACRELKIEPTFTRNNWEDDETIAYAVVSLNLKRRHLNESQRAMVAARIKPIYEKAAERRMKAGVVADPRGKKGSSAKLAATDLHVGERTVMHASRVLEQATKELVHAVDTGLIAVTAAATLSKFPEMLQKKITKMIAEGKAKNVRLALKAERNREQVKLIQATDAATGEYSCVVVDPPWRFNKTRPDDDTQRGQTPYPTMAEAEISAIKIPAADNCILWLWVTNAHLVTGEASRVLYAWGFEPKTLLTWRKNRVGVGDWLRGVTEHAILATKGHPVMMGPIPSTYFEADVGEHSEKPQAFYDLVEAHCPGTKVELFARKPRDGWAQFGAELKK